ncbi:MAG TPA: hypothetical protein VK335_01370, partial [Bryobacteraceae bacterium]|nr:hypothetical protein [Bryobacteraceae bacterium]
MDGAKEWIGTELTFDLREENGATVVLFAQRGWKEQVEFMHGCVAKIQRRRRAFGSPQDRFRFQAAIPNSMPTYRAWPAGSSFATHLT